MSTYVPKERLKDNLLFAVQMSREDLISFCVTTDRFFEINAHHVIIADALTRFFKGETKKLILQTPPRSGKSRMMQEAIAWAFGIMEGQDVIYTGHSLGLLEGFSRSIRDRVKSIEYGAIFNNTIKEGNEAVGDWSTTNGNRLMIYGVWGGITGRGGHKLVIDDPFATRQDAESDTMRKRVSDWYWSTFLSRRHSENSGICLIMQRWREDDLVGEILAKENDWEVVKIPAISEDGVSFWPSRFSVEYLQKMRESIGEYFFQSQYQQEPFVDGGGDFKKDLFQYYGSNDLPPNMRVFSFLDPAISQRQEADSTAIVTVGIDGFNRIRILDIFHEKVQPDAIINAVFSTVSRWNPQKFGIEVVQYQKMLALEIRKQMNLRNQFFNLEEINPMGEKEARIRTTLQPRYGNLSVLHPKNHPKLSALEAELLKFPNGKHDDIVDALSGAVRLAQVNTTLSNKIYVPSYSGI